MKNVIELIRVSTGQQAADHRGGIPAQRAVNVRTARQYALKVVYTIEVTDVSGKFVLDSPEFRRMMELMQDPNIHGVVTKEFSRLMRPENFDDYALLQHFINTECLLYLPDGPIDLSTKTGKLLGTIRAAIAGLERQEILSRMIDAKEALRRQGKHPSGRTCLPYGLAYSKQEGWRYTAEAEKVRKAFELVLSSNRAYADIARELNLNRTGLRVILSNPIYTGWRVYDTKRDPKASGYVSGPDGRQGYRKKIARPPDEVIRVRVIDEPLVSETVFNRVQSILNSRAVRQKAVRSQNGPKFMLNGFLICAQCDEPMYSHANQKATYYYCKRNSTRERQKDPNNRCGNPYILSGKIESKIEDVLSVKLQDKNFLYSIAEATCRVPAPEAIAAPVDMTSQFEELKAKRERILDSYFDGLIDISMRDKRLTQVDAELKAFQKLEKGSKGSTQDVPFTPDEIANALSVFAEFPVLQREEKRTLLGSLGTEVAVSGYIISKIVFNNLYGSNIVSRSKTETLRLPALPCRLRFRRASCWLRR